MYFLPGFSSSLSSLWKSPKNIYENALHLSKILPPKKRHFCPYKWQKPRVYRGFWRRYLFYRHIMASVYKKDILPLFCTDSNYSLLICIIAYFAKKQKPFSIFALIFFPIARCRRIEKEIPIGITFPSFCPYTPTKRFALITTILFRAFACPF